MTPHSVDRVPSLKTLCQRIVFEEKLKKLRGRLIKPFVHIDSKENVIILAYVISKKFKEATYVRLSDTSMLISFYGLTL